MKANHNECGVVGYTSTAVADISKVLKMKANHNMCRCKLAVAIAVADISKVLKMKANHNRRGSSRCNVNALPSCQRVYVRLGAGVFSHPAILFQGNISRVQTIAHSYLTGILCFVIVSPCKLDSISTRVILYLCTAIGIY